MTVKRMQTCDIGALTNYINGKINIRNKFY